MSATLAVKNGVKARKVHHCLLCGERIDRGSIYDFRSGVGDRSFWTMRMHPECHAHEQVPGTVDATWYECCNTPAFERPKSDTP